MTITSWDEVWIARGGLKFKVNVGFEDNPKEFKVRNIELINGDNEVAFELTKPQIKDCSLEMDDIKEEVLKSISVQGIAQNDGGGE